MKKSHVTVLAVAVGLVLAGFAAVVILQTRRPQVDNAFEVLNTVEYRGHEGRFTSHSAGVLGIDQLNAGPEGIPYSYGLSAEAAFHEDYDGAEWNIADLHLIRDPETERLTGGTEFFKNMAVVANNVLNQVKEPVPLDGETRTRRFRLNARSSDFPDELTYRLSGSRQRLTRYGDCAAVLAKSEPFSYTDPETGQIIRAVHRKLAVLDDSMNELYFLCSAFTAHHGRGELHIEILMTRMEGKEAISLEGLDEEFHEYFESLELETRESELASTDAMPMWAMHSLAVRGAADITAGGAIEGKSNFAITATVGLVLLADAGVSLTTGLMEEAGVIDWKWDGIPNYVGQGVGLGAAAGYSAVSGSEVDSDRWREAGGLGGDVASLFIPTHAKAHGVRVGTKGVKTVKTGLAGKNLRISRQGMDIVRGGSGWQGSAEVGRRLFDVQNTLSAARTGVHGWEFASDLEDRKHAKIADEKFFSEIATILPSDTMAYLSVPDVQRFEQMMENSILIDLIEDEWDSGEKEKYHAFRQKIKNVEEFHSILKGFREGLPQFVFVVDIVEKDPTKFFTDTFEGEISLIGNIDAVDLHRYETEADGLFETLLLATHGNRLFVGNDRSSMEEIVRAAQHGLDDSLARHEDHRSVTSDWRRGSVFGYASIEKIVQTMERDMRERDRRSFREFREGTGLSEVRAGSLAIDSDGGGLSLSFAADESGERYQRFKRGTAGPKRLAEFVPQDALFFASASLPVTEEKRKDILKQYFYTFILLFFRYDISQEFEDEFGVTFEEITAAAGDEIGFFVAGENKFALIAFTQDAERAHDLMETVSPREIQRSRHKGIDIHTGVDRWREISWAIENNLIVISPQEDFVRIVLDAWTDGDFLSSSTKYQSLLDELPPKNSFQMYVNIWSFLKDDPDIRSMPPYLRRWFENLRLGGGLSAGQGKIKLHIISKDIIPLFIILFGNQVRELFGASTARMSGQEDVKIKDVDDHD